jgi:PTH1 family peptidyl-tRNA hydrolase
MKLIIGLGNPGRPYQDSRHNIGFKVIQALAREYKVSFKRESGTFSLIARVKINHQGVVLAIPFTFMNLSGAAIRPLLKRYKIGVDSLLVVHDDLDLEFSRLKIQKSGSSGGHRGLKSIIYSLGSQEFSRLRIGIGRPSPDTDAAEYVLSSFTKKEKGKVKQIVEKASQCCQAWIRDGLTRAMNMFNCKI